MAQGSEYFDALETRDPAIRERDAFAALGAQIENAIAEAPGWARILAGVDARAIQDRATLAKLPVTRKSDLPALQAALPPFGGLATRGARRVSWIFSSPGPVYEPGMRGQDFWRMGRALYAAGFRAGDIAHNSFAYHLTPAGHMMEAGAHAVGCAVVPGGVGNTEAQLKAIADIRPHGYIGTPSFLRILLDKAKDTGADIGSLTKASVGGEALGPSLRAEFKARGIAALQSYGTADLGLIGYETKAEQGFVVDEGVLVEIVRPGTGEPLGEGEVGEVVVTTLNRIYPLIRFATGDLSAVLSGRSLCGRTNMRLKGWLGRADQTTKVKGMFVTPGQIDQVVKRHAEIGRARLVVSHVEKADSMTLQCEVARPGPGLADAIAASLHALTKLRGEVTLVAPGSLANDGKVIEDQRKYD